MAIQVDFLISTNQAKLQYSKSICYDRVNNIDIIDINRNLLNSFLFQINKFTIRITILIFILANLIVSNTIKAQWPNTYKYDQEYTNTGNMLATLEDNNGGVFVVYTIHQYHNDNTQTGIPYFFHIDKFGYKTAPDVELTRINDFQTEMELYHASDGNLFVASMDNIFTEFINGLAKYRQRSAIMKIDTIGNSLWDSPILVTIDSVSHFRYQVEPDRGGGCYVSVTRGRSKNVQKISSEGERLWGDNGIEVYEGIQTNGLHYIPPNINLKSDGNLFVHTVTNIYSPSKVDLVSNNGNILLETELDSTLITFNSFLNSDDELLHLGYHGKHNYGAENLVLNKFITTQDSIVEKETVLMDYTKHDLYHMKSIIDLSNNIHLLWEYYDEKTKGKVSYFQVIDDSTYLVFDSLGIKIPQYTSDFLSQNGEITFILVDSLSLFRINLNATPIWGNKGKIFTLDDCVSSDNKLVSDGNGGVIVLWNSCVSGIRAKQINKDGQFGVVTSINSGKNLIPAEYYVSQNYPNPFNSTTKIDFNIPLTTNVTIEVFNLLGEVVYSEKENEKIPGKYEFIFETSELSSGVYFIRFYFENINSTIKYSTTNKLILLK